MEDDRPGPSLKKIFSEQPTASIYVPVNRMGVTWPRGLPILSNIKVAWLPRMLNPIVVPFPPCESGLNVMIMAMSLDINFYCDSHSIIKLKRKFTCKHHIFCFL